MFSLNSPYMMSLSCLLTILCFAYLPTTETCKNKEGKKPINSGTRIYYIYDIKTSKIFTPTAGSNGRTTHPPPTTSILSTTLTTSSVLLTPKTQVRCTCHECNLLPQKYHTYVSVRKLDLSHLCFSLNFYCLMFLLQFPSMFPLLTYSQLLIFLSDNHSRHSRQNRSKISIHLITGTV